MSSCHEFTHNKALVQMQTTLRFVCTSQLDRYVQMNGSGLQTGKWMA